MDISAKLRPFYILKILKEQTDENHSLTTVELSEILKKEYGIDSHRTTIYSDIEMLQQLGYGIQSVRSTQKRYNYIDREFDDAELKLLIDAVESSKFITKSKSEELVTKLTNLAGIHKADELRRNLVVDGRYKAGNEHIYYSIDAINDAINRKKKIQFQKFEYNVKKEQVLHNDGEVYLFSPYSLVWDGDFYYVVGYSDKYQSIGSHRVDRIAKMITIMEEDAVPAPEDFDINRYINTMFRMYNAPRQEVDLICANDTMDAIIDHFGQDVKTYACDMENFRVITEVAVGTVFFNWIFGFKGKVRIQGPEEVKDEYQKLINAAVNEVGLEQ